MRAVNYGLDPQTEAARIAALHEYGLLDTAPEPPFDAFVKLVATICDTPIALVSLVDSKRQWFKANVGLTEVEETPREISFCSYAIRQTTLFEVPDTRVDSRFAANPLVTGAENFRYYAGMPLIDRDGRVLGTLCALDHRPRQLTQVQRDAMATLAKSLVTLIEARKGVSADMLRYLSILSSALENTSDPVAILSVADDKTTSIAYVNPAFCELFKYDAANLLGQPLSRLTGVATDATKIERLRAAIAEGVAGTETIFLYTSSGGRRLVEIRDRVIDARHRIVSARDLTRIHETQEALVRTHERLHALYEISAARGTTHVAQIEAALDVALKALGMQSGYVGEIDGDFIRMRHVVGEHLQARGIVLDLRKTYVFDTLAAGDVLAISDLSMTKTTRADVPTYQGWHGYISAPLTVEGTVFGAIGFLTRDIVSFDQADLDFTRLVATLISTLLEREFLSARLDRLAYYDGLTELANRANFLRSLEATLQEAIAQHLRFAVHFIDLDGFKAVNDRFGHAEGDRVLRETARRLLTVADSGNHLVARLGGDEFVIIQTTVADALDAKRLGSQIVAVLGEPFLAENVNVRLGGSVGIAIYPDDAIDVRSLLTRADEALYRAKAKGKNRLQIVSER